MILLSCLSQAAENQDHRLYELRIYYAAPNKLDALNARFRDHTVKLFEKHGIINIGYWIPTPNPDNKLVYIVAFPDQEARDKSWKSFGADPLWQEARKKSELDGRLVSKVESILMNATQFSPPIQLAVNNPPACFELRDYIASPGNLDKLKKRFQDHTVTLFKKHGMKQIGYWSPIDKKQGADNRLIYILSHVDQNSAEASFKNFRSDPAWIEAKKASEAQGALTEKVTSTFMVPTDYSPMK